MTSARVLVVDDTDHVRATIVSMLALDGFEVVAQTGDPLQAVGLAVRHDPHVVVMDLRMPGVDGLEATRRVRAVRPDQQVLLFTAYLDDDLAGQAREAGAALVVSKIDGIAVLAREVSRLTLALSRSDRPTIEVLGGRVETPDETGTAVKGWTA